MSTRSAVLAVGSLTGRPSNTLYTAPSDAVVLLKSANFHNSAANPAHAYLIVSRPGRVQVNIFEMTLQTNVPGIWSGWVVLEAGDTIALFWDQGLINYWLSGSILPPRHAPQNP